ncbi:hypothetical protein ACFX1R_030627 [Malus domestica]
MSGEEYSDETRLLRSSSDIIKDNNAGVSAEKDSDLEAQEGLISSRRSSISPTSRRGGVGGFKDLLIKHLDGVWGLSGHHLSIKCGRDNSPNHGGREVRGQLSAVDHPHHHNQHHQIQQQVTIGWKLSKQIQRGKKANSLQRPKVKINTNSDFRNTIKR